MEKAFLESLTDLELVKLRHDLKKAGDKKELAQVDEVLKERIKNRPVVPVKL